MPEAAWRVGTVIVDKLIQAVTRYPLLLSLVLGALAATGFAPLIWWPVTLACFALWMLLIHDAPTLKQVLLRGWIFGVAHFTVGNNWIQRAFTYQDAMPHWLGYLAVVLLSLYLALYPAIATGLAWRFARARPVGNNRTMAGSGFVLVFAAAWIATEWLRGTLFTGYPWNPLSEIWLPIVPLAAIGRLVGTYALSGLTIVVAGSLLLLVQRRWRFAAGTAVSALVLALASLGPVPVSTRTLDTAPRIRVIQPNLDQEERPRDDYAEQNLLAIEALSGTPGPAPRLIVWPEGALRFFIEDGYPAISYWRGDPLVTRRRIASRLGPNDIVLAGGNALKFDAQGNVTAGTNSVFAIDSRARILGRYDKAHLVPWGEYLPMRPIMSAIGLSRLVPGDFDFDPGQAAGGFTLPAFGNVGFQICYEMIFSGETVDRRHRPAFIFNPSNDSWYGSWGPVQHLAQARMRAIEEGLPIIRATPTGISAIIDANGTLLATVPPNVAGAIELPIPPPHEPTLFARVGNLMAFVTAAVMLLFAVAIRRWPR
ncbi:apolipoprotein N-acyltransferase [Sphingomonas alpina]|uniref:Apolipoprotein N-acyltransferase n=1 Tax=Sphingomonas alpina TaxID=653931 RepID=A0A7H0LDN3_9SPHN|nr:apolipoprotein N-acyltransferase [Sphingomonas alpina]QNQ07786.1 apolipoprotein N-acyltransferase [Sphingomonas alpina]